MDSVDQDVLDRLSRDLGGDAAVLRIVSLYLEKLPAEGSGLHDLAGSGEMAALADGAHRLKSSTAMLGATRLADILAEVEVASKARDAGEVGRLLEQFDAERAVVEEEMDSLEST